MTSKTNVPALPVQIMQKLILKCALNLFNVHFNVECLCVAQITFFFSENMVQNVFVNTCMKMSCHCMSVLLLAHCSEMFDNDNVDEANSLKSEQSLSLSSF